MTLIKRPSCFDEVVGQQQVVDRLKITTQGCLKTGSPMPHTLIDGPPGLGKTTLAAAIAGELGVNMYQANAASLRSVKVVMPYLYRMTKNAVFFIDEIHRLPKLVEEFLYPAMEDFKVHIVTDGEPETIDIPVFTLIGATTSGGSLSQPFYDRFSIKEHLAFYSDEELADLAEVSSQQLGLSLNRDNLIAIAQRSKGTPRILHSRLQWYRDFCVFNNREADVDEAFEAQGIDKFGMDIYDRTYINILLENKGNPLGLRSLSAMTGIAIDTIENSIEPYLVRKGFVRRTQNGRVIGNFNVELKD